MTDPNEVKATTLGRRILDMRALRKNLIASTVMVQRMESEALAAIHALCKMDDYSVDITTPNGDSGIDMRITWKKKDLTTLISIPERQEMKHRIQQIEALGFKSMSGGEDTTHDIHFDFKVR